VLANEVDSTFKIGSIAGEYCKLFDRGHLVCI
jgi:hypothetical protein